MRLINTRTLELHDFYLSDIPPYAILSHTWGDGEVSFQDMSSPGRASKPGYAKIVHTCRLAQQEGLEFAWADTCCIEKSSSAELTESINSMFEWYKNAAVCYVSLADLPANSSALGSCRWFTRGWTLQELLAPQRLEFYDMTWTFVGSRLSFIDDIANITKIPRTVLRGSMALSDCSIAARMSWAASRQTRRVEDVAYCLLGIFNVHMPLIYGEGQAAFRRLQEEIVKRNNDLTIFAWDMSQHCLDNQQILGLFSQSPAGFAYSSGVRPFADDFLEFSVTNKGLLCPGGIILRVLATPGKEDVSRIYGIFLGTDTRGEPAICLRKIGPGLFHRDGRFPLNAIFQGDVYQVGIFENASSFHIIIDPTAAKKVPFSAFRNRAIHVPFDSRFELVATTPEYLWDITDRIFLRPKPYIWCRYPMTIAMSFKVNFLDIKTRLVVLCDYRQVGPVCKIFEWERYKREAELVFGDKHKEMSIPLSDLETQQSGIASLENYVDVSAKDGVFRISVLLEKGIVESVSTDVELFSVVLKSAKLIKQHK